MLQRELNSSPGCGARVVDAPGSQVGLAEAGHRRRWSGDQFHRRTLLHGFFEERQPLADTPGQSQGVTEERGRVNESDRDVCRPRDRDTALEQRNGSWEVSLAKIESPKP